MKHLILTALVASGIALPSLASAQTTDVRVRATVSGEWVLNPLACADTREDIRDSRVTTNRADRREDRRDQRVVNCPASAYTFVPDRGQAPSQPIRLGRSQVQQQYESVQPTYNQPTYNQPRYVQPTRTQPRYVPPQTYRPQPAAPSNYTIINGRIVFKN